MRRTPSVARAVERQHRNYVSVQVGGGCRQKTPERRTAVDAGQRVGDESAREPGVGFAFGLTHGIADDLHRHGLMQLARREGQRVSHC